MNYADIGLDSSTPKLWEEEESIKKVFIVFEYIFMDPRGHFPNTPWLLCLILLLMQESREMYINSVRKSDVKQVHRWPEFRGSMNHSHNPHKCFWKGGCIRGIERDFKMRILWSSIELHVVNCNMNLIWFFKPFYVHVKYSPSTEFDCRWWMRKKFFCTLPKALCSEQERNL